VTSSITRRIFFKASGAAAAGVAASVPAAAAPGPATAADSRYPRLRLGVASALRVNEMVSFSYPDSASPCALIKMGVRVPGGVGVDGDIVAYSTLCTHMGCPVSYDAQARSFKCSCHFSQFDPEMGGQMICGQATENLPRVTLAVSSDGTISAVGVQGLIYGRQSNLL
jgi:arsenite oxidase small subunit